MKVLKAFDLNRINAFMMGNKISIYSLLIDEQNDSMLVGCGIWDRENQPHTNTVKDATPGKVLRISSRHGRIMGQTVNLPNIVYPLIRLPWGHYFVGCRTGAALTMNEKLSTNQIGSFGRGIYGVLHYAKLNKFFIGGRDGKLYIFDHLWKLEKSIQIASDRLWNLCADPDHRYLWSSCYNKKLYKIDSVSGEIVWQEDLGIGATTLVCALANGQLAVGGMNFKIALLNDGVIRQTISTPSPVCFVMDLPESKSFVVTGYKGQIWLFNYQGKLIDEFVSGSRENNPIWIVQSLAPDTAVFAWANGTIGTIQL